MYKTWAMRIVKFDESRGVVWITNDLRKRVKWQSPFGACGKTWEKLGQQPEPSQQGKC
jgi:hypothetical protein